MQHPPHTPLSEHVNNTWRRVRYKLYSSSFCHSLPHMPKYIPERLALKHGATSPMFEPTRHTTQTRQVLRQTRYVTTAELYNSLKFLPFTRIGDVFRNASRVAERRRGNGGTVSRYTLFRSRPRHPLPDSAWVHIHSISSTFQDHFRTERSQWKQIYLPESIFVLRFDNKATVLRVFSLRLVFE